MRILFITSSTNASGGSRQALYLAVGMRERGHEVSFFAARSSMLRNLAPSMDWRDLPEKRGQWRAALEAALLEHGGMEPTIVHAFHNKAVKALAWSGTLWRLTGKPVACVAHRGVIFRPNNFLPYILPGIRLFAVNSRACLNTLPLLWRKDVGKVVYNGIPRSKVTPGRSPEEVRAEMGVAPEADVIGYVGNNASVKGLEYLIRAFARMRAEGQVLCLVGVKEGLWSSLCRETSILDSVRFVDRTERVADYMQIFTLFVLPSLSESSPNTLLEAMCMGLPAVCSNVGGVPECISDKRYLVPPKDDAALAAAIVTALADRETLAGTAKRNLAFSGQFSLERKLDIMEGLYGDLLSPYSR